MDYRGGVVVSLLCLFFEACRLCVFAYEYFVLLGRVTNPPAKPPFLEDQFVSLSLFSLLRPVRLGRPYQEHKVPAGIARKVIEARKPTHPTATRWRQSGESKPEIYVNDIS